MVRGRIALALVLVAIAAIPIGSVGVDRSDPILSKLSESLGAAGVSIVGGTVSDTEDRIDVLIHVDEPSPGAYRERLERTGADIGYRFRFVDAYEATVPISSLARLSALDRVKYIEWNAPGKLDLEVSTATINTPRVWSSTVLEGSASSPGPKGRGITIAVVDSGIDAGHPDLDYGEKTIDNVKAAQAGAPWIAMENTDTSVGHGSHCAGIAAGNGDASAGGRSGVAPEACLVGLSMTEGTVEVSTANYLYGLEWVFEHSGPGSTYLDPPIRVCTNSWHTTVGEYDPEMAISKIINRLTYENNVVCTFSAGNDGRNDPEGTTVWTSQQGATPAAIMVAAYERDGSAAAEFTSHGKVGLNHTYPDVGAPGVQIWATHARRTGISAGSVIGGNPNPYYLAISGTSMSTPHIAGAVALLFEACPSLGISNVEECYSGDDPDWFRSHPYRFIHEAELILEASATPIAYVEGEEDSTRIYVNDTSTGWGARSIDYVQGYGLVDLEKAVSIALTLDCLRGSNPAEVVTVFDALYSSDDVLRSDITGSCDDLVSSWKGEYSRYNDQNNKPLIVQNQTKYLYVPEGASGLSLDLRYTPFSASDLYAGGISLTVDYDLDGVADHDIGGALPARPGIYDIPIEGTGAYYGIYVEGQGIRVLKAFKGSSYMELRIPYSVTATITLSGGDSSADSSVYSYPMNAPLMIEVPQGSTQATLGSTVYDLSASRLPPTTHGQGEGGGGGGAWLWLLVILALVSIAGWALVRKFRKR
jgi:subtilisin family serine protease